MYIAHFGLKQAPFKITPNTEFFFSGGNRGAVLDALIYAINSGEGIIKVVGEVGSGKTMLCRMLQTQLPSSIESVFLANPSVAPEDILHAIAFELQLNLPPRADRLQVMQVLQQYLLERHAAGKQVLIFVEEAQGMPLATLEEIRLLSNLETRNDKLLQIVLFGQPELDRHLDEVHIRQLRERITHSFHLGPLKENEIGEYLIFRLRAAGYFGPHLFSPAAIRLIYQASLGLVRRTNILADKALLAAFSENLYQVTPRQVRAAIKDSEFGKDFVNRTLASRFYLGMAAMLLLGLVLGFVLQKRWDSQVLPGVAGSVKIRAEPAVVNLNAKPALNVGSKTTVAASASGRKPNTPRNEAAIVPEETRAESDDLLLQRLQVTQIWLQQQAASAISIQLFGSADEQKIKQQLELLVHQIEGDKLYVYRTKVRNTPFITVVYGTFASRAEAAKAIKVLPRGLRSYQPQLRTVGGIRKELT